MNWIIRCAKQSCRHICDEADWLSVKTANPLVSQLVCPKCGCKSYYRANAKDLAMLNQQSARLEAAIAAE